jgi:Raf kinase inhibitor-like YbhB/YbcL family protein
MQRRRKMVAVRAPRMLLLLVIAPILGACAEEPDMADAITVTSTAFDEGGAIPARYGCDGEDVSPPLAWEGAPDGTMAFALILDDPDAGGFVHWIVADIPASSPSAAEGASPGIDGRNDFGRRGYGGPCPPSGTHRYVVTIYALSEPLSVEPGFSAGELRSAMEGRILATGRLTGTYRRGG